ncbi:hypothetical protein VKT23_011153 [Stygiomarasmius scandens]|uniref:F-box domain-containing protein n=1 Tax=Marasmiellus scandens TaxID=2682957 RepID=A0ABR1JA27_9AGAR
MSQPFIQCLPTEILCDIFQLALQPCAAVLEESFDETDIPSGGTALLYSSFKVFDIRTGPWTLARTCRRWREVVFSSPTLWRSFHLGSPPESGQNAMQMLMTCLNLSAGLPLVFSVEADDICQHNDCQELLRLLSSESDRWFIVQIINPSFRFWRALAVSGVIQPLSLLKEISFLSAYPDEYDDPPTVGLPLLYDVFARGQTPALDTIINHDYLTLSRFNIPWSQMMAYDGAVSVAPNEHFRVLDRAPNLVQCSLAFATDEDDTVVPYGRPLLMPRLQKLQTEFLFYSEEHICPALQDLVTPALEELAIMAGGLHANPPFGVFASILRASSCSLQYLELSGIASDHPEAVHGLLQTSATIIHLRIWINTLIHLTVIPMLNARDHPSLVPRLKCLDLAQIDTRDVWSVDMSTLADAVRTRMESNRPDGVSYGTYNLHTVRFALRTYRILDLPAGFPPILEVLQGEGLHVAVCRTIDQWRM